MRSKPPFIRVGFGPDWLYAHGALLFVQIAPRPDLMRPDEEGFVTLVGLTINVRLRSPWNRFHECWVSPIRISVWSDADEIATRIAGAIPC